MLWTGSPSPTDRTATVGRHGTTLPDTGPSRQKTALSVSQTPSPNDGAAAIRLQIATIRQVTWYDAAAICYDSQRFAKFCYFSSQDRATKIAEVVPL